MHYLFIYIYINYICVQNTIERFEEESLWKVPADREETNWSDLFFSPVDWKNKLQTSGDPPRTN